jgi:glutathione S-transferase
MTDLVTLYHSPNTRSTGVLTLFEELGVPFNLHPINMKAGEQRAPAYLAINPMGKVPALMHRGQLVTEQVAIYIYLADLYPQAGLAPALDSPLRGPYLRFLAFYGSCFEPAAMDRAAKREPTSQMASPYGSFDDTVATITARLREGPYILGEQFSAADVLWGMALMWMTSFKLIPETPEVTDYVKRVTSRPSFVRAREHDTALVTEHEAAAAA